MFLERRDQRRVLRRRTHLPRVERRQVRVGEEARPGAVGICGGGPTAASQQRLPDALRADGAAALVARVARRARRDVVLT